MITFSKKKRKGGKRSPKGEVYTWHSSRELSEDFYISYLGVYAWIGINFVLGRFDHEDGE